MTSPQTAQYDALAMSPDEHDEIDDLVVTIVGKPKAERTATETAVLKQASQLEALRGRIANYAVAYSAKEKELGLAVEAGQQQAEIIGKFHEFVAGLEQAVTVAEKKNLLVGEHYAMKCILSDAKRAAGLTTEDEDQ